MVANAQCACVSLILNTMLVEVCASRSRVVLHVAVGHYTLSSFLSTVIAVLANILVDGRLLFSVSGKRKE